MVDLHVDDCYLGRSCQPYRQKSTLTEFPLKTRSFFVSRPHLLHNPDNISLLRNSSTTCPLFLAPFPSRKPLVSTQKNLKIKENQRAPAVGIPISHHCPVTCTAATFASGLFPRLLYNTGDPSGPRYQQTPSLQIFRSTNISPSAVLLPLSVQHFFSVAAPRIKASASSVDTFEG